MQESCDGRELGTIVGRQDIGSRGVEGNLKRGKVYFAYIQGDEQKEGRETGLLVGTFL